MLLESRESSILKDYMPFSSSSEVQSLIFSDIDVSLTGSSKSLLQGFKETTAVLISRGIPSYELVKSLLHGFNEPKLLRLRSE